MKPESVWRYTSYFQLKSYKMMTRSTPHSRMPSPTRSSTSKYNLGIRQPFRSMETQLHRAVIPFSLAPENDKKKFSCITTEMSSSRHLLFLLDESENQPMGSLDISAGTRIFFFFIWVLEKCPVLEITARWLQPERLFYFPTTTVITQSKHENANRLGQLSSSERP